jgi:hypothetical protein
MVLKSHRKNRHRFAASAQKFIRKPQCREKIFPPMSIDEYLAFLV